MIWFLLSALALTQSAPALRIVVVEGEDAVNIVQQKTAVGPVVEVRDRNNLPVAGVVVTFSIEGAKGATFGGASTLTVATNAAGQAAVTGLTPTAAGAVQINVSAALQGQIATATITQTNVMTAAQAAAASGGGGLSATTIGIAGAAIAGGAVAATQLAQQDEGDNVYSGSFSGTLTSTIVSTANTCVVTRNVAATMTITLDSTEGQIRGRADIEGTDTVASATCPATQSSSFHENTDVSGTPAALGFRVTRSNTSPDPLDGGTIESTTVVVLEASLSGDTITGTLKFNENSTKSGPTSNTEATVGTFPIALRRGR